MRKHVWWGLAAALVLVAVTAAAEVVLKSNGTKVGPVNSINCGTGLTCARVGDQANLTGTGGASPITEAWHEIGAGGEPAFQNSWVNYGESAPYGTYPNAGFYKDPSGRVHLRGVVKSGSVGNYAIFTLPAGYRPSGLMSFMGWSGSGAGFALVQDDGNVKLLTGYNSDWSLDQISFRAEP